MIRDKTASQYYGWTATIALLLLSLVVSVASRPAVAVGGHASPLTHLRASLSFSDLNGRNNKSIDNNDKYLILRGGGEAEKQVAIATTTTTTSPTALSLHTRRAVIWVQAHPWTVVTSLILMGLAYMQRSVWVTLLDKEHIQQTTLDLLGKLSDQPNAQLWYATGMVVWEALGLSTIPVETAAGRVFGVKGLLPSVGGKLVGALLAFWIGRFLLHDWVQANLLLPKASPINAKNKDSAPLLALLQYNTQGPFVTALLMKFSMFPEFIKNVGTAVLFPSVSWPIFLLATTCHGAIFSFVWTLLGAEDTSLVPSWVMTIVIPTILVLGMGLPPLLMAWWAGRLRRERQMVAKQRAISSQWAWKKPGRTVY